MSRRSESKRKPPALRQAEDGLDAIKLPMRPLKWPQFIEGKWVPVTNKRKATALVPLARRGTGETLETLTLQIVGAWETLEQSADETRCLISDWLLQIRDNKLWHPKFSSFKEYCEKELPFGRRRAYQVIDVQEVKVELGEDEKRASQPERHLLELAKVPAGKRAEVLRKANELAQAEGKPLMTRHIALARGQYQFHAAKKALETKEQIQARKLDDDWRRACKGVRRDFMARRSTDPDVIIAAAAKIIVDKPHLLAAD